MSFCPSCTQGVTLTGDPKGTWIPRGKDNGGLGLTLNAYLAPAPTTPTTTTTALPIDDATTAAQPPAAPAVEDATQTPKKNVAVIILMDAFGFGIQNPKVMADQFAECVGCDVWVPDYFEGK